MCCGAVTGVKHIPLSDAMLLLKVPSATWLLTEAALPTVVVTGVVGGEKSAIHFSAECTAMKAPKLASVGTSRMRRSAIGAPAAMAMIWTTSMPWRVLSGPVQVAGR